MIRKLRIRKMLTNNWRPKLISLLCAIFVWYVVDRLLVKGGESEWDTEDIRISLPE